MAVTLWQTFAAMAAARPEAPALWQGDRSESRSSLHDRACGWAVALPAGPGDRVVIAAANSVPLAAAVAGLWARGAIPVFVPAEAPAAHLAHALALTGAVALLADRAAPPGCGVPVVAMGPGAAEPDPAPVPPPLPDQPATAPGSIVFTSGSTGRPKGVTQAAATLAAGVERVASALGYRAGDRLICPVPFAFDYGWGQLLSCLVGGWPLVLPETKGALALTAALARHRPTVLAGVPAVFADLLAGLAPIRDIDRGSVRLITNTGSKIPDPVRRELMTLFPEAALSLNYGLTETYRSATLPLNLAADLPLSVGFALPGAEILVLRADGREAGPEEEGEIVHRGAGSFLGYWGEPERTAAVLRPVPGDRGGVPAVLTGDLGRKDAAGRLYIHGRRDRQMKSMGMRVSPDEIEAMLMESGLLAEAAVVARPHDMLGQMIVAVVVPKPGRDPAEVLRALKRLARETMSPAMQPRDHLVLAALPRTPSGKVDYPALTRLVEGRADG